MKNNKIIKTIIFVVVMMIPIIYSFFYLKSYWNPYGDLTGMKIAVVNLDKGENDENQGKEFLQGLKDDGTFDICDVTLDEANEGMQDGKYYATITVPANFTECLNSAGKTDKQIATITYSPNQASNYLATQIINSAVKTMELNLEEKINSKIVDSLADNLEDVPNKLEKISDGAEQILDGSKSLNSGIEQLNNGATELNNSYTKFDEGVASAYEGSKQVENGLNKTSDGINTLSNGANSLDSAISQINSGVENLENGANSGISQLSSGIGNLYTGINGNGNTPGLNDAVQNYIKNATTLENLAVSSNNTVSTLSVDINDYTISVNNLISAIQTGDNQNLNNLINEVQSKKAKVDQDKVVISKTTEGMAQISNGLMPYNSIITNGSQNLANGITTLSQKTKDLADLTNGIEDLKVALSQVKGGTNSLKSGVSTLNTGVTLLKVGSESLSNGLYKLNTSSNSVKDALEKLNNGTNSAFNGSKALVNGVNTFNNEINIGIQDTKEKLSDLDGIEQFAENPVKFETVAYGKVDSYGMAFLPLFLCIGLWVGALMAYVVLYYDQKNRYEKLGSSSKNKILQNVIYIALGAIQGIVTAVLLKAGLGFEVQNVMLYYVSSILIGITFMGIIQFLIRNFGDVGKFLALIILVLQLAASGGTFPIETINKGFQSITPYLPMTYSINLLREILVPTEINFKAKYFGILIGITFVTLTITFVVDVVKNKKINK